MPGRGWGIVDEIMHVATHTGSGGGHVGALRFGNRDAGRRSKTSLSYPHIYLDPTSLRKMSMRRRRSPPTPPPNAEPSEDGGVKVEVSRSWVSWWLSPVSSGDSSDWSPPTDCLFLAVGQVKSEETAVRIKMEVEGL